MILLWELTEEKCRNTISVMPASVNITTLYTLYCLRNMLYICYVRVSICMSTCMLFQHFVYCLPFKLKKSWFKKLIVKMCVCERDWGRERREKPSETENDRVTVARGPCSVFFFALFFPCILTLAENVRHIPVVQRKVDFHTCFMYEGIQPQQKGSSLFTLGRS